jgi:ribosomal protein S28E/S33
VTVRTLQNWQQSAADAVATTGRPPHDAAACYRALRLVGRALRQQGYGAGWRTVAQALGDAVPVMLVQRAVRAWKQRRRARRRRGQERRRHHVEVLARDVLWALDATHLTRVAGTKVEAQVLRDAASARTVGLSVGPPVTARDALALLEHAREERGGLPLVLARDNGSPYTATSVQSYLAAHQVIELRNLPRTPQHNPWAERAIGELKADSGLDMRDRPSAMLSLAQDPDLFEPDRTIEGPSQGPSASGRALWTVTAVQLAVRLDASRRRLDRHRLRASRGYRTALQCDQELPPWQALVDRADFYATTRRAIERAVDGVEGARARRLAEREAIFETLERVGLIRRTRGGAPLPPVKHESVS